MLLPNILVVDDDPTLISWLGKLLKDVGRVRFAKSGREALQLARAHRPDLILLDVEMPDMSGFEVCATLKETVALSQVPVIFLTTHDSAEQEVTGLALGASDFIAKPPREHLLLTRVKLQLRMHELTTALSATSAVDPITGLASREHFIDALDIECARASRSGSPLAVLRITLDHLRAYGAEHGEVKAEHALRSLSTVMRACLQRNSDLLARYADSELAAILPDTDGVGAMRVAHNVVAAVDSQGVQYLRSPTAGHVTASVGVTVHAGPRTPRPPLRTSNGPVYPASAADVLAAAERAAVSARRAGGHCVCFVAVEGVANAPAAPVHTAVVNVE